MKDAVDLLNDQLAGVRQADVKDPATARGIPCRRLDPTVTYLHDTNRSSQIEGP